MNKRKTLIIGLSFAIFVVFAMVGLTYAFFTASVGGNREASSTIVETAELKLVFNGTEIIQMEEALPGQSVTKTFTVENKGNTEIEYIIDITDVINEFQSGDLVYTLTSTNAGATANKEVLPTSDKTLKTATIAPGVVQTYTLEILFRETGSNQNSSQGARFSGKLQINAIGEYSLALVRVAGTVVDENNDPMPNITIELHSEVKSAVTDENGKFSISGVMLGIHTLVVKDSNGVQKTSKMVEIEDNVTGVNIKLKNDGTSEITGVTTRTTLTEKMLADNNEQSDANIDYSYSSEGKGYDEDWYEITDENQVTNGLYYTEENTEGNERVYFYRGAVTNNYVVFGSYEEDLTEIRGYYSSTSSSYERYNSLAECNNASSYNYNCEEVTVASAGSAMCWRIVRTVEDGSVRLIYGGTPTQNGETYTCPQTGTAVNIASSQAYNTSYNNKSYVNYKTSAIRTTVENWYRDNIAPHTSLTNLIADTPYCNEMSERTSESTIYFGAYDRLYTNKSPQYKCEDSTYGYTVAKGDLTYPVGLLTADEVSYAGEALWVDNTSYYLNTNEWYWTMSPYYFDSSGAYMFNLRSAGTLDTRLVINSFAVVPAVSLKPEATVKRGTGAYNDPFVINTD